MAMASRITELIVTARLVARRNLIRLIQRTGNSNTRLSAALELEEMDRDSTYIPSFNYPKTKD